jgi:endonuclease/exonuclease/phosphatase family metal-dependent hydrolase
MSYNIRWCRESKDCLDRVGAAIAEERPDVVFLAAVYAECGGCAVENQVAHLTRASGLHSWAFGENFRWGVPFRRVRSGNALLSAFPRRAVATVQLPGGPRFYEPLFGPPLGNRRALWVEVQIGGRWLLAASLHNESWDLATNLEQTRAILEYVGGREALLGGDFNAPRGSPPLEALRASERFSGEFEGPPTYPATSPDRCFDYVLAPRTWRLVDHRVLGLQVSAHLPVVSTFEIPAS